MADFQQDDDVIGKAYDSKLMRRLMSYAKPYRGWFVLGIMVTMLIAGADIVRPYMIKVAIDEYVSGYDVPMARFPKGQTPAEIAPKYRMEYAGHVYVREKYLPSDLKPVAHYQLLNVDSKYVLIGSVLPQNHSEAEIVYRDNAPFLLADGREYPAVILEKADIDDFRRFDMSAIGKLTSILLAVGIAAFFLSYAQTVGLQHVGQKIVYTIREETFTHLQKMDLSYFDKNPVGRLVTRVTNDTETLNEMYTSVIVNLFKDVFMLVGIVVVMFELNTELAWLSLATLPLIIMSTMVFRVKSREAYRKVRTTLARINASMSENISGMRIVQVFGREQKKYDEFAQVNEDYYKAGLGEMMVYAVFRPIMELIGSLALALVVWHGGKHVIAGTMQFGMVYAFVNYVQQFFQPINDLTEKYNILQAAMASSERVFQLLDTPICVKDPEHPVLPHRLNGEIEFKNVWFAYNEEDWVLRDVSFKIEPGQMVAFVGATGAGKTSIISLINRLYDIQKGQILIDGVDIRSYSLDDLRRNVAAVLQDVFLFTGDIKGNIRLNNPQISDERIHEVATYVNADRFIQSLPAKYDEPVTERGSTLSAGQRQLLAFARALAFDPSILVLDEATANIDTETEALIQDALPKLIAGRTTIVVAHRLSTIQHADKIIVIHKGKVRETGTHQELLANHGIYYDLYRLQYKQDFMTDNGAPSGGGIGSLDHADSIA